MPTIAWNSEVGTLAVNPGDGALFIGTSAGAFRVPPGAGRPEKFKTAMTVPGRGSGPLIDLVLRFTGPDALLASGHSMGGSLPVNVGLMSSPDDGRSWQSVSGMNNADYHDLEIAGSLVLGLRIDQPNSIQVSHDGGGTFSSVEAPSAAAALDIAINPGNPKMWAVGTAQGTYISNNAGGSWRQRDTTSKTRVAWAAADRLYTAGLDGQVRLSPDGGKSWSVVGTIGAGPMDFVAGPGESLYAYVTGGKVFHSADGGKTWAELVKVAI